MEQLDNLRKLREINKLTREELASISGVKAETINALERGRSNVNNVKLSTLIKLANGLNCKVIDLLPIEIKRKII